MSKARKRALNNTERRKVAISSEFELWQGKVARVLVILLMCIVPLYFTSERYLTLAKQKYEFFMLCMCVILLAVLVIWVLRMVIKPRLFPQDKLEVADWAVLGFAAVTVLSALLTPFGEDASVWGGLYGRYDGAIAQLMYVAIFFIVSRWYKPRMMDLNFFCMSAILVALIGILQFYGMDFFRLWPNHLAEHRADNFYDIFFRTTLGNVNTVSAYACVAVLLCGFLFVRKAPRSEDGGGGWTAGVRWQPLWVAASALSFWLMEIGGSDSGRVGVLAAAFLAVPFIVESMKCLGRFLILVSSWLAVYALQRLLYEVVILDARTMGSLIPFVVLFVLLAVAGFILIRFGEEPNPEAAAKWKLGVIIIVACIAAGIFGIEVMGQPEMNSGRVITEAREILHGNIPDEFGTNRVYIWRNALGAFAANPIIGTGPDTFALAFPQEAQGFYGEFYDKAHNEYIQLLICQGMLGLLCYLVFLGAVLFTSIRKAFKNPLAAALAVAIVGYCVQAFFNISTPTVTHLLWVSAGMLVNKRVRAWHA